MEKTTQKKKKKEKRKQISVTTVTRYVDISYLTL